MYKNYVFDLYGTLVDIRTDESTDFLWDKMVRFYGFYEAFYTREEMKEAYNKAVKEQMEELYREMKGQPGIENIDDVEIKLEKVFLKLFTDKGVKADMELAVHAGQMFRVISMEYERLYDGVIDFLDALKEKGKKIYLLSNAQYIFTGYEINALGLRKYFDGVFISSNECCKKPSKEFYEKLLDKYNLKKEETIMIGNDHICDIQGAARVGLDTLYIYQDISPDYVEEECPATYRILDGDFRKVKDLILK